MPKITITIDEYCREIGDEIAQRILRREIKKHEALYG